MGSESPEQPEGTTAKPNTPSESDVFTTLHHLVSRIDAEDRMQEVVDQAQRLQPEDTQLLVDCLSMALDKNAAPLKTRLYVWRALISVASSAKVFAQNHVLRADYLTPDNSSPGVYRISGEPSVRVKLLKHNQDDTRTHYSELDIGWAHLSHPNVLPSFAVFFEGSDYPCLVSPYLSGRNVCDYVRANPKIPRMPLISDIVSGLFHIHQFDIVHGRLYPQSVLISDDRQAFITDSSAASECQDSGSGSVRYSAPEVLEDDDIQPTKAADMWSFACICYEVLSGKIPFYQFVQERKLFFAVAKGAKPIRPEGDGHGGDEIDETIWQLLSMCWELEPTDRPTCLKVHQIFLGMGIRDGRPMAKSIITLESFSINLNRARANLTGVLGSDHAYSHRVPENIQRSLLKLIPDTAKWKATAAAAAKLSPDDAQCFVDFLDLILEDFPDWTSLERDATRTLLSSLIMSTRIMPQHYMLNGVQYDPQAPIAEGSFGRAYKGRGLNIRVNVVTNPNTIRSFLKQLPNWSHSSHPNTLPFYGVFHEKSIEAVRLCVVNPLWTNGNLRDYAPSLPQKSRMLLLCDAIKSLVYIHGLDFAFGSRPMTPEYFLISDQGRAVVAPFAAYRVFTEIGTTMSTYELRFAAPGITDSRIDDIWSFGCLCYEVLSRKPPYWQYPEATQIQFVVSQGELPRRPESVKNDTIDYIDDQAWSIIRKCCMQQWRRRPSASALHELIADLGMEDNRPEAECLPKSDLLALRSRPDVDFPRVEAMLDKIQVELLRTPLSKLVQNQIKDVAAAATELKTDDTRALVDFLDLALKDHLSISEERKRVLALLSRVTSSTHIFPQRYEVKGIKYCPTPIAEGGFGTVHQGSDLNMCIKIMTRVDPKALTEWVKELILWANSSHPNVLPFYGVFLESVGGDPRVCLVSPFMRNGNLFGYAPRLSQKSRLPLILDVIIGLSYLHGLGIIHSDLKGQNVLISDEGRGLITDFGASHIVTATAAATTSTVYSTLRFAAPELMQDGAQPSRECDIWAFGCLCYQVLSRKVPFFQYARDFQVAAALSRKEVPKRPGLAERKDEDDEDEDDWDEEEDWDPIDDQAWNLITKCCMPEPEDRLKIPAIQELIADMRVWDDRPPMKAAPGAEIFKLRLNPEIDLDRVGEILDKLQTIVAPSELGPQLTFVDLYNSLT